MKLSFKWHNINVNDSFMEVYGDANAFMATVKSSMKMVPYIVPS